MLVETFVAEGSVEALHKRVLGWLAGLNEVQANAASVGPTVQSMADELRPVVRDDDFGQPTLLDELLEHSSHTSSRKRPVDFDGQTLAAELVHNRQRSESISTSPQSYFSAGSYAYFSFNVDNVNQNRSNNLWSPSWTLPFKTNRQVNWYVMPGAWSSAVAFAQTHP